MNSFSFIVTVCCMVLVFSCNKQAQSVRSDTSTGRPQKDYAEPPHIELNNVHWILREMEGTPIKAHQDVYVRFLENGTVEGFAGCNNFNGRYTSKGDSLKVESLMSTKMTCDDADIENRLFYILKQAASYTTDSKFMYLRNADHETLAKLEAVYR